MSREDEKMAQEINRDDKFDRTQTHCQLSLIELKKIDRTASLINGKEIHIFVIFVKFGIESMGQLKIPENRSDQIQLLDGYLTLMIKAETDT
ncbi:hypothetical protein OUZ56_030536 [Daphnia magna]|uniref:Uncharacterized protein n=1 Tax=Daphnia magna TaxID=35525 RepID=A0ABQ9ZRL8_9CRUS|nr:hypothetical protein OUZ56_030536 [Daphnia magna]